VQGVPDVAVVRQRGSAPHSAQELRGLLHDLGHGLATLSYLADGIREDPGLSSESRERLRLVEQELSRMLELVRVRTCEPAAEHVEVRELLRQLVAVVAASTDVRIVLRADEAVTLHTDPMMLWRMVSNLVDNAVRAVGRGGTVVVGVSAADGAETAVEVTDDGPGFVETSGPESAPRVPDGLASLGIGIVSGLAQRCGAVLQLGPAKPRGTRARIVFPSRQAFGA
jgi:signal transduction histidine kinase